MMDESNITLDTGLTRKNVRDHTILIMPLSFDAQTILVSERRF